MSNSILFHTKAEALKYAAEWLEGFELDENPRYRGYGVDSRDCDKSNMEPNWDGDGQFACLTFSNGDEDYFLGYDEEGGKYEIFADGEKVGEADCWYRAKMKVDELRENEDYEDKEFYCISEYGKEYFD